MYTKGYHDLGTPAAAGSERTRPPITGGRVLSDPPGTVTLDIDGTSVSVPEGTSIMRAAALASRDIPKLCATDSLKSFGSCRLCLVEIEGRRGYPASCTTP